MSSNFLTELKNNILTITFNRPDKFNTMTMAMMFELADMFKMVNKNDDVKCVIVTGAGDYFTAGADLSSGLDGFELSEFVETLKGKYDQDEINRLSPGSQLAFALYYCIKPIIAAINGPAAGVGSTLILPMDFRLMSEEAKISYVFTRRGFVTEAGSSWLLPRVVGITKASDWVLTGRIINPQEALDAGLINGIYKKDELLPAAYELATKLVTTTSAVAVACSKQLLWRMLESNDIAESTALESSCFVDLLQNNDAQEGAKAFIEKRAPHFTDKVSQHMPRLFSWWGKN